MRSLGNLGYFLPLHHPIKSSQQSAEYFTMIFLPLPIYFAKTYVPFWVCSPPHVCVCAARSRMLPGSTQGCSVVGF